MSSPDETPPQHQCGALQKYGGSDLRGTQGKFGDMERCEQRNALRNDVRWRGRTGNCGRGYTGKGMMAASMSAGPVRGLVTIVL